MLHRITYGYSKIHLILFLMMDIEIVFMVHITFEMEVR